MAESEAFLGEADYGKPMFMDLLEVFARFFSFKNRREPQVTCHKRRKHCPARPFSVVLPNLLRNRSEKRF